VQNFETQPLPNGGSYDCVGYYGTTCGQPNPEWRHRFGIAWNMPWNLMAGLTWRYISSVNVDSSSSNPLLTGAFNPPDLEIGSPELLRPRTAVGNQQELLGPRWYQQPVRQGSAGRDPNDRRPVGQR